MHPRPSWRGLLHNTLAFTAGSGFLLKLPLKIFYLQRSSVSQWDGGSCDEEIHREPLRQEPDAIGKELVPGTVSSHVARIRVIKRYI